MSDYENDELQEVGDEELLQTEFDDSDVEEPNVDEPDDSDVEEPNVDEPDDSDVEEPNVDEPDDSDVEEPNVDDSDEEEPNVDDEEKPNVDDDEEPNVDDPEIDDLNEDDENEGLINEKLGVEKEFEITKEDLEQQDEESEEEPEEEDEEYTIDDFEEDNLQKINDNFKKNMILENHPESLNHNIMEIKALSNVIRDKDGRIMDDLHKTNPFITKYEKTRILGLRAKQINSGSKPFVNVPLNIIDGYTIANMEYKEKKIPFIIRRPIPNGGSEYWKVKDLEQLI